MLHTNMVQTYSYRRIQNLVNHFAKRTIFDVWQCSDYACGYRLFHQYDSVSKVFLTSFFWEKLRYNNQSSINISSEKFYIALAVLQLDTTYSLVTTSSNVVSSDESYLVLRFFSQSQRINFSLRDYFFIKIKKASLEVYLALCGIARPPRPNVAQFNLKFQLKQKSSFTKLT